MLSAVNLPTRWKAHGRKSRASESGMATETPAPIESKSHTKSYNAVCVDCSLGVFTVGICHI